MGKQAYVIVVGAEKGGVGKSTIAVNMAHRLQESSYETLLMDTDTTGTANKWHMNREAQQRARSIPVVQNTVAPLSTIKAMSDKYDVIVVDVGARDYEKLGPLAKMCDLWILPTGVGQAELESTAGVFGAFQQFNSHHKSRQAIPLVALFNMAIRAGEEAIAREDLQSACPDLTILRSSLRNRKVYRDAHKLGMTIYERPRRDSEDAANEFDAFIQEAMSHVRMAA